jgi:hypothetical protein
MKRRAIAIAIRRTHPLTNILDFMYGTPERTRMTLAFVYVCIALGILMSVQEAYSATAVCPV